MPDRISTIEKLTDQLRGVLSLLIRAMALPITLLPRFPYQLFQLSIFLGLSAMVVLAWLSSNLWADYTIARSGSLDALTFYLDPLAVQFAWAAFISVYIIRNSGGGHPRQARMAAAFLPWAILLACYLVGDQLYKPVFGYSRPAGRMEEPWLTDLMGFFFERSARDVGGNATPSGFVLRQIALFYTLLLVSAQRSRPSRRRVQLRVVQVMNLLVLLGIGFSRFYRRAHSLFDFSLSIGIGTVVFWLLVTPLYRASSSRYRETLLNSVAVLLLLFGVTFYYAKYPAMLLQHSFYLLFFIVLFYAIVEWLGSAETSKPDQGGISDA